VVGPVPADTIVPLTIGLPVRDPAGLQTFIQQVSDPKSPTFRKYLTQAHLRCHRRRLPGPPGMGHRRRPRVCGWRGPSTSRFARSASR
jgi:hypothetical protein